MYSAPTYEADAFPQLGYSRCQCGRVARGSVHDKATGRDRPACLVCTNFYDRLWEEQDKKVRWGELAPRDRKKAGRPPLVRR